MHTLFISDIHLSCADEEIRRCFLKFLTASVKQTNALYILGDLFEIWIGDDDTSSWVKEIQQALCQVSARGIKIYLMQGNRDFLLGKKWAAACGAVLLKDPFVVDLYGTPTLLTHGDLLCTEDIQYQKWRRFVHQKFIQKLFLSLPLRWRQRIADKLRNKSREYTQNLSSEKMDVTLSFLEKWIARYQVTQIIHGHTHRPALHKTETYTRYVLPAWHPKGGMVIAKPHSPPELVIF